MDFSMPVYAFVRLLMGIKNSRRKRNDSKMTAVQTTASLRHASKFARVTLTLRTTRSNTMPDRRSFLGFRGLANHSTIPNAEKLHSCKIG